MAAVANAGVLAPAGTILTTGPIARSIVAPSTIARVPSLDSAVIQSDRIGGNFAYSVSEAHAHAVSTPVIQHVATPVAVSYSAPQIVQQQVVQQVAVPQVAVQRVAVQQVAVPQVAAVRTIAGLPAGTVLLKK